MKGLKAKGKSIENIPEIPGQLLEVLLHDKEARVGSPERKPYLTAPDYNYGLYKGLKGLSEPVSSYQGQT